MDIENDYAPMRNALAALTAYVSVIAEPGRFISGPSVTRLVTVIAKALRNGLHWYCLDDGVYGSFSGQIYEHMRYLFETEMRIPTTLFRRDHTGKQACFATSCFGSF